MNSSQLSLRELRRTACLFETVLLSLLDAGVAGEKACFLEGRTGFGLCLKNRSCNSKTDCTRLTSITAAYDIDADVILSLCADFGEGLLDDVLCGTLREVILERSVVDDDLTAAGGNEPNAGNRLLSATSAPILQLLFQICFRHFITSH